MPTTLLFGKPEYFCKAMTITSNGFVIHITKAFGDVFLIPSATCFIILRLIPNPLNVSYTLHSSWLSWIPMVY